MYIDKELIIVITLLLAVSSQVQAKITIKNKERMHQRPSFESLDINSDTGISFDEFSSHKIPHGDHQTVFSLFDTDNNGVISKEEFVNHKPRHPKNKKRNSND